MYLCFRLQNGFKVDSEKPKACSLMFGFRNTDVIEDKNVQMSIPLLRPICEDVCDDGRRVVDMG